MSKQHMNNTAPKVALSRFSRSLLLMLGMFVVFIIVFAIYVRAEKQIDRANELRQHSYLLADELRQSSDDLTRMVRTYVATGDRVYKQHYQEILDIRDGRRARPERYEDIYWDLVMADDQRPCPDGQAVALLELMRRAGFTDAEFAKMAQAKANSDELTKPEFAAMALIESSSPATAANRIRATRMLYDAAYHRAKADIMRPISEFSRMMDQRTLRAVHDAENMATSVRVILMATGLLLIFTLSRAYRALNSTLGCSVDELQAQIARLGSGDLSSPIPVAQGMEDSVLGWLSTTRTNLARIDARRRNAEDNVRQLAFYDQLTELPNRRLFNDRLKQAMLGSKRSGCYGALMFLDLDNFKQLNDTYGHAVGDLLLIEVAQRLKSCVREIDTVARFGGDEFIVMLVDLNEDKAESIMQTGIVAEKIRTRLAEPYRLTIKNDGKANADIEYRCAASIGVTMFRNDVPSEDEILTMADSAMYRAKESGRNMIRFADLKQ